MFACNHCDKTYASRNTLARHERNHRASTDFACESCHVRFKRRDLLRRHRLIHTSDGNANQSRRRCHTACDRCKARRAKCDGSRPCSQCTSNSWTCTFQRPFGRISERTPTTPFDTAHYPLDNETEEGVGQRASRASQVDDHRRVMQIQDAMPLTTPLNDFDASNSFLDEVEADLASRPATNLDMNAFWPFSTSWQWTHEDLYFQGNSSSPDLGTGELDVNMQSWIDHDQVHGYNAVVPLAPQGSQTTPHLQSTSRSQKLSEVVSEMVQRATSSTAIDKSFDPDTLSIWSCQMSQSIGDTGIDHGTLLQHLVGQYFTYFHPLWPFVPTSSVNTVRRHPLLYCTLTSIGALYSGPDLAPKYGSLMHTKLRSALVELPTRLEQTEDEALDVGRAILLNQVAALYFEQEGAFSAAQQLAARLNAHAHRMRLFDVQRMVSRSNHHTPAEKDALMAEGRRMLAYGILRAETYMSVLFNRRPMLSYEEVALPLPFADSSTELMGANVQTSTPARGPSCDGMLFSDLIRVALDPGERLPLLRPVDLELLMFGLQQDVWKFSHDPDIFLRLVSERQPGLSRQDFFSIDASPAPGANTRSKSPEVDLLDHSKRRMQRLIREFREIHTALHKWRNAMSQSQLSYPVEGSRSAYLSGMILLELSFLRLNAPVDAVLQVAYQLRSPSSTDDTLQDYIVVWASSPQAHTAVKHARTIWSLLNAESSRSAPQEAKYNIMALIALHIAAAVTWAVAGSDRMLDVYFLGHERDPTLMLRRVNTKHLMLKFVDLYPRITFSWGMQSSFSKIVKEMAGHPFPLPHGQGSETDPM